MRQRNILLAGLALSLLLLLCEQRSRQKHQLHNTPVLTRKRKVDAAPAIHTYALTPYEYMGKTTHSKFSIANHYGAYMLGLKQTFSPPLTMIGLPQEPYRHNFPAWDFFRVEINHIPQSVLEPKSVEEWRDGDRAGWKFRFNFNGVFFDLRFFMRPDSPMLYCKGILDPLAGVEVKQIRVELICYPGKMVTHHFLSEIYERVVFTPERTLPIIQTKKWPKPLSLTPADRLLIFNDRKHLPPDGTGPCAVLLDWRNLAGVEVTAGAKSYQAKTTLIVNPASRTFRLAIFSSKKTYGETELVKYLTPFISF